MDKGNQAAEKTRLDAFFKYPTKHRSWSPATTVQIVQIAPFKSRGKEAMEIAERT